VLCLINFVPLHPSYKDKKDWELDADLITMVPLPSKKGKRTRWSLKRTDYYWDRDEVKIEEIHVRMYEDPLSLSRDVNAGKIEWTTLQALDYASLESAGTGKNCAQPHVCHQFSFFSPARKKPFDDPRVRKGLALLLPWNDLRSKEYSL